MTIKLNVIGDPIEHSKSPEVHGSILNILKIPYVTCDNDSDGIYHALAEMGIL